MAYYIQLSFLRLTVLLMGSCILFPAVPALAQSKLKPAISQQADALESKVIAWRRDFHEHPELGNQELRR